MYLGDIYTVSVNLSGVPAISIPCGQSQSGLPIGMQLIGAPFEEEKLLSIASLFEKKYDNK
jgi:aspartyl-tRNA(Asn)/glutamyl-tRNA(Gln) amidotransferase subunit A